MISPDEAMKLSKTYLHHSGEWVHITDIGLAALINDVIAKERKACAHECESACDVERILSRA